MLDMYRFNPTLERLDLQNGHVISWKWHLQETRPQFWWRFRCWSFTDISLRAHPVDLLPPGERYLAVNPWANTQ